MKIEGTGNDFILFDNRKRIIKALKETARNLCRRALGIGADGLIAVEKSRTADFRMRIINSDGSEAEMCGNGARCAAFYAYIKKIAGRKMVMDTPAGQVRAEIKSLSGNVAGRVLVGLTRPSEMELLNIRYKGKNYQTCFINTGVPHAVIILSEIEKPDVGAFGRFVRYHRIFSPKGANVDFMWILSKNKISIRTYERGVEGETLACGTGAVASAIAGGIVRGLISPVTVLTESGESLNISFSLTAGGKPEKAFLEGPVKVTFTGRVIIN